MSDIQTANHIEVARLPYKQIVADNDNIRLTLTGIGELADSIWAAGLLNPITVRKNGEGKYHITAGYRRHAAIGQLIEEGRWEGPVPVLVRTDEDDESRMVAMIVENLPHVDVNPVDEALGMQRLVEQYSFTLDDVVLNLGVSERIVKDRLALCQLTELAMAAVRAGKLSVESGVMLSKAPARVQDKIAKGGEYDCSPGRVRSVIATEAAAALRNDVKKRLADLNVEIEKDGYSTPKGYERTNHELVIVPSTVGKIADWVHRHVNLGGDLVRISTAYQEAKVTLAHYAKLDPAKVAKADSKVAEQRAAAEAKHEAAMREHVPADVWEWYEACKTISDQIDDQEQLLQQLDAEVRVGFVRKLATADVAAAAIKSKAIQAADNLNHYCTYGAAHNQQARQYVLAILGVEDVEPYPWGPVTDRFTIRTWVLADKKRTLAMAAVELMPRDPYNRHAHDLEAKFAEAVAEAAASGDDPVTILTFPPAPASLNAILVAAQGETFEEANQGDITWQNIEATVEALADGEFAPDESEGPTQAEADAIDAADAAVVDGPSDEELAAIEAEGDD